MGDSAQRTINVPRQADIAVSAARRRADTLLREIASKAEAWHRRMSDAQRETTANGATAEELGRLPPEEWGFDWPVNYDDIREACRCLAAIGFRPAAERVDTDYRSALTYWFDANVAGAFDDLPPEERERLSSKLGSVPAAPAKPEQYEALYHRRLFATAGISDLAKLIRTLLLDLEAAETDDDRCASGQPPSVPQLDNAGGDLLTTSELAALAMVTPKTLLNNLSASRTDANANPRPPEPAIKGSGQTPDRYSYAAILPWLRCTWPPNSARFPDSFDAARQILANDRAA